MIIDAHCHAGTGDLMTAPWNTAAPLDKYLRRACAAGIDKTVLVAAFHTDYDAANAGVARIIARHPDRFVGFAFVHARRDAGRIREMVGRAVRQWAFRGIKVHGSEAMPTREVCAAALAFDLPVLVDVHDRPHVIDLFATEYPGVNFIIAHLGSFMDDWRAQQQVVDKLVRYPNVYADTSGVRRFDYIVEGVQRAGARKLVFGSDGPWLHPGLELHKIRLLGLSEADERLVLGGTIARLIRRTRRRTGEPTRPSVFPQRALAGGVFGGA